MTTASETLSSSSVLDEIRLSPNDSFLQTGMLQEAIELLTAQGGGRIVLEPGLYVSGTLVLKDGVTLHLEKGATLSASENIVDYKRREGRAGARLGGSESFTSLIFAEGASNIALTGEGTIDGNGQAFYRKRTSPAPDWIEESKKYGLWIPGFDAELTGGQRPRALILFANCSNLQIEIANVRNSPAWTIHLLACTNALLRGITLRGDLNGPNIDGIDLDGCSDVRVEDCDIFTGDDAIALKNTNLWDMRRPCRNITVTACRLRSTTHGFTIGTETQEDFENIKVSHCSIEKAGEYGTLTGLGLSMIDGARLKNITVNDCVIEDAIAPIQLRLANAGRGQTQISPGSIENVSLVNISIKRSKGNCLVMGLPNHPLRNVVLRDISFELVDVVNEELMLKTLPDFETEFPPREVWRLLPAYGMFCRDIDGLSLENLSFVSRSDDPRPSLGLDRVTNVATQPMKTNCVKSSEP